MRTIFFVVLLLGTLSACSRSSNLLEQALEQSGANRQELEKVLSHYVGDTLKQDAARFLIENMPGHYTLNSSQLAAYRAEMDSLYPDMSSVVKRVIYSVPWHNDFELDSCCLIEDVRVIKGDYLIRHIDNAFAMWKGCSWLKDLSFEDFCEYLLPYRLGDEPLAEQDETYDWWKVVSRWIDDYQFVPSMLDDVRLFQRMHIVGDDYLYYKNITVRGKEWLRALNCLDQCYYDVLGFRQTGIPSAIDMIPDWPTRNGRHYWRTIIDGACVDENYPMTSTPAAAKVYRMTYSHNPIPTPDGRDSIPELFRDPFLRDVTEKYVKTSDLEVRLPRDFRGKAPKYLYLAVFNDLEWKPIAWSRVKGGKAHFERMGRNLVYLPVCYRGGEMQCAGEPLFVDRMGRVKPLVADRERTVTMTLTRKYPLTYPKIQWGRAVEGSVLEAANDVSFVRPDTLVTVASMGTALNWVTLPTGTDKAYRYWRVSKQGRPVTLAELKCILPGGQQAEGTPLSSGRGGFNLKAFDGDPLTYNNYMDWVGIDLGQARTLQEVRLLPRTDDNGIAVGHLYKLFYFGRNGWVEVATQRATGQELTFADVPGGALYWLQDVTRGREERIFTYEGGRVVFH